MAVPATLVVVHPSSEPAIDILYRYNADIVGRFHGREVSDEEVRQVMADEPSDDLTGDSGVFVVAYLGTEVVGCGGARFVSDDVAELTRVFVDTGARGGGVGASQVEFLEEFVRHALNGVHYRRASSSTRRSDTETSASDAVNSSHAF